MEQQDLRTTLGNIPRPQTADRGGGTRTGHALRQVREKMFGRTDAGVARVVVVISDGLASVGFGPDDEADLLKEQITIISVGVGNNGASANAKRLLRFSS